MSQLPVSKSHDLNKEVKRIGNQIQAMLHLDSPMCVMVIISTWTLLLSAEEVSVVTICDSCISLHLENSENPGQLLSSICAYYTLLLLEIKQLSRTWYSLNHFLCKNIYVFTRK